MKKSWNRPELTVLVRTRPEEAILGTCKNTSTYGGNKDADGKCFAFFDGEACAGPCDTQYSS